MFEKSKTKKKSQQITDTIYSREIISRWRELVAFRVFAVMYFIARTRETRQIQKKIRALEYILVSNAITKQHFVKSVQCKLSQMKKKLSYSNRNVEKLTQ